MPNWALFSPIVHPDRVLHDDVHCSTHILQSRAKLGLVQLIIHPDSSQSNLLRRVLQAQRSAVAAGGVGGRRQGGRRRGDESNTLSRVMQAQRGAVAAGGGEEDLGGMEEEMRIVHRSHNAGGKLEDICRA